MRTIKRISTSLNIGKIKLLQDIALAYAREKQDWLTFFQQRAQLAKIKQPRQIRDQMVKQQYQSKHRLQGRMWKLALEDAASTMDKYWCSLFEKIKYKVYMNQHLSGEERHYAFWLIKDYQRLAALLSGTVLEVIPANGGSPELNNLSLASKKHVVNFMQRKLKQLRKNYPRVKVARSFSLDSDCYHCFEHNQRQYIAIMSLTKGKRLVIPLSGKTKISGNLKLVLNHDQAQIHYCSEVKSNPPRAKEIIALDLGYSEALVTNTGISYGAGFGQHQTSNSDWLKTKLQKRNKLDALANKYTQSANKQQRDKAQAIKANNLGQTKLNNRLQRYKASSLQIINTSLNQLCTDTQPNIVISEDLSHKFSFKLCKNWNRKLSAWLRGVLTERIKFKALAKGFSHKVVNAAYTSQTCPDCGYVDRANRASHNPDRFVCRHCGHAGHADVFAAQNLKARYFDHEITRYTPYRAVKDILLTRFHANCAHTSWCH